MMECAYAYLAAPKGILRSFAKGGAAFVPGCVSKIKACFLAPATAGIHVVPLAMPFGVCHNASTNQIKI